MSADGRYDTVVTGKASFKWVKLKECGGLGLPYRKRFPIRVKETQKIRKVNKFCMGEKYFLNGRKL